MIRSALCIGFALVALSAKADSILGIKTSYTNDKKIEEEIDLILENANQGIANTPGGEALFHAPESGKSDGKDLSWKSDASSQLLTGTPRKITLEELYIRAIAYSTQIQVFSDVPLIRETAIQEAKGVFDTHGFLDSAYEYTNDPVSTLLETGLATGRFTQKEFRNEAGVRKRLGTGAEMTLAQEFGFVENNSSFLVPNPQGTARLKLAIVQPLLRGAGLAYNRAIIDIAKIDTQAASHEQVRQAESHLLEICRSYWTLYFSRVSYVRKKRFFQEAVAVTDELNARNEVDTIQGQIMRARSAVAFRESELARAEMDIANAQDRIRTLVNSPDLADMGAPELIPTDPVYSQKYPVNYQLAARRAIMQRPEILQAILQIRASAVRVAMSKNELLPQLNLLLQGYVAGVDENRDMGGAWNNQFNQGGPGALVGFSIEFPFENNAARARHERRRLEMRQQFSQLKTTIDTVLLEVKASVREVETSWRDYSAKLRSVQAASADLSQFTARREVDTTSTPDASSTGGRSQSWYLDEWLNSQTRLEYAEQDFARVATIYQVALVNLERAQGNLLKFEDISIVRTTDENKLPLLQLRKGEAQPSDGLAK